MMPPSSTGPPCANVGRQFETNRLAKDCQARVYAFLWTVLRQQGTEAAATVATRRGPVENEQVQGGIAA
jgi:hypothetical protein